MPSIELTDEELQGFVHLCATASGPGVSWMLTNALLTKARLAQEAKADKSGQTGLSTLSTAERQAAIQAQQGKPPGNSEDHDAAVPRA